MNDELHALLGEVRRRWLAVTGARTLGRALIAAAGPLALGVAIDLPFAPRNELLLLLGVGAVVGSAAAAATILWRSRRRPDDRQLARFIEEQVAREPSEAPLDDALVSAVDAANGTDPFARLVVASAVTRLRAIPATTIVPRPAMNRAVGEAIGGIAAFALVAIAARGPSARVFDTARVMLFPGTIHVTVLPGNARVAAGHPLRIRAAIRGADAVLQRITPALTVTSGAGQRTVAMARSGDGFEFAFESVDRSFKYRVTAGAATSEEYAVTALFAPRVQRIDLRYVYPAFAGLSPHEESGSGDIYAPAGTRVHLAVHTDRPAEGGDLAFAHLPAAGLRPTSDRLLEGDIVLSQEDSYRVRLSSPEGLRSGGDTEYFIRLVDDRPPDVRILRPAGDQKITPLEEVTIEARADDDYGLSRFELVYSVGGRPERVVPFTRVTGTAVEKVGTHLLAAEDLHVQPGDVVTYYARARDVARGKQSTEAKSDIFFLEVKPFNAEFAAAESQAGGGAPGTQIDALVAAQKEIINATWNLERRSSAGRSAADLAAVAQAQAQLKQRAEQMGGAGGRQQPGMSRPPQQIVAPRRERPDAGGDPVGAAVAAMGRALQQLQAQHTKDAIPHEMAALQGLLQAQAEVRRRQVAQQQAGSGAGSGRQGEDLSALFDKELQRQQRTNYETRAHAENPPEKQERGDAADRVRDLAKRQEDLSQRQRDLARSGVSEEERRRQLEKLTREQNELRSELEQLARREGQQGASQAQGQRGSGEQRQGQSGQQGSASPRAAGGMRGASDQMRAATADLQRQDPNAAAGNGQRAAEQLRQLEQDMRGGGAVGRQRAAGELQLEAQQLADEQRRIAAEAERLGASGRGADEARRRLAGDKERLADRVDQLQRSAKRAGSAPGKDTGAQGAAGAARELERQRVAERMRETARSLRAGPGRAEGEGQQASAERQLARTMQGVVDKLGGEGGADARRLAGELDQTRQVRERLNDLERRIRDAQGRGDSRRGNEQLQQLRDEYARELQRARQAFAPDGQGDQRTGAGASTPEQQEYSRSAPGTEAFKQDFSKWESLRKEIDLALEKHDAAVSARLAGKLGADRLSGGGSERVPDAYRAMIAKYYESLAKVK